MGKEAEEAVRKWRLKLKAAQKRHEKETDRIEDRKRAYKGETPAWGMDDDVENVRAPLVFRNVKEMQLKAVFQVPPVKLRPRSAGPPRWLDPGNPGQLLPRSITFPGVDGQAVEVPTEDLMGARPPDRYEWEVNAQLTEKLCNRYLQQVETLKTIELVSLEGAITNSYGVVTYEPEVIERTEDGEKRLIPVSEKIRVRRVDPKDVLLDQEATSIEEARWVALRVWLSPDQLKKSHFYKHTEDIEAHRMALGMAEEFEAQVVDLSGSDHEVFRRDFGRVETWHIWDIENRRHIVLAEGIDVPIREESAKQMGYPNTLHPLAMLVYNEVPGELFGKSDVALQMDLQDAYNKSRSQSLDSVRRANPTILYMEGSMKATELEKLVQPSPYKVVATIDPPERAIKEFMPTGLNAAVLTEAAHTKSDLQEISGVGANQLGGGAGIETATEATFVSRNVQLRANERAVKVARFIRDIALRVLDLVQNKLTLSQEIREVRFGESGEAPFWRTLDAEQLEGDFDIEVGIGEAGPRDINTDRQEFNAFLAGGAQIPGFALYLNQRELIRKWASLWNIDPDRLLRSEEEVQAQLQAQQEAAAGEQNMRIAQMLMGGGGGSPPKALGSPSPPAAKGAGGGGGLSQVAGGGL